MPMISSLLAITLAAPGISPPPVKQPIARAADPMLVVSHTATETYAGDDTSVTLELRGLHGATEVHLYQFNPGCEFEQQPRVSGRSLFPQVSSGALPFYTTDKPTDSTASAGPPAAGRVPSTPTTNGIAVASDGTALITTSGVYRLSGGNGAFKAFFDPATALVTEYERSVTFPTETFEECKARGVIVWKDGASGEWRTKDLAGVIRPLASVMKDSAPQALRTQPWSLARGVRHTIDETADLEELLKPAMAGHGTCKGVSDTLFGKFSVGVGKKGGDITFKIRSGPAGTRCAFALDALKLPQGTDIEEVRFSVDKVGTKCRLGAAATLPGDLAALLIPSFLSSPTLDRTEGFVLKPTTLTSTGAKSVAARGWWANPLTEPSSGKFVAWNLVMPSWVGTLQCDATAVNDHGITLRVDSITYRAPVGVTIQ